MTYLIVGKMVILIENLNSKLSYKTGKTTIGWAEGTRRTANARKFQFDFQFGKFDLYGHI